MDDQLPRFFRLSLLPRLLLAALAGLPMAYAFNHFDYAFYLEGFLLGLFVLTPALTIRSTLWLRVLVAISLGVLGVVVLFYVTLALDDFGYFAGPTIVTLTLILLFARLTRWTITRRFLGISAVASVCAGLFFYAFLSRLWSWLCFDPCPWWNDLVFPTSWAVWHLVICTALFFGSQTGQAD